MPSLKPVDEAIAHLLGLVRPTRETEVRELESALGCCLAEDVVSPVDVPPADNSAMDGYVFQYGSVSAGEWLEVSDRIPAGYVGLELTEGTVARIFTGAQIPEGADTVVMQENTESREGEVRILEMPDFMDNVRNQGQDIQRGSVVVEKGTRLSPQALALLASVGVAEVRVYSPLSIAILSTGDELVEPGGEVEPGQIFNSNRFALSGLLRQAGFNVVDFGIVPDTAEATEQVLVRAAAAADCIVTTGGVSVGEEDHVKDVVERLGKIELWKLAIKPGKPLAYGEVMEVPFFGLPGNPVSTFVTFLIVARPYLLAKQGFTSVHNATSIGEADFSFTAGSRREYIRVRHVVRADGRTVLEKYPNQGSGIMSSVVWADALAEIEIDQVVTPGDQLKIYPL